MFRRNPVERPARPLARPAQLAIVAVAALVAAGCTSSGSTSSATTTPAPDSDAAAAAGSPTPTDQATNLSDDEVITAFVAALDAGDKAAAATLAPSEALVPFEPWEPLPGIAVNYRDGALFQIQPGPGWVVDCTVGGGRVVSCEERFDGEEGDDAGAPITGDETLEFVPGQFGTFVSNSIGGGEQFLYSIDASAGQSLVVQLSLSEGTATYDVIAPSGDALTGASIASASLLPENGTYTISVQSGPDPATYDLDVWAYGAELVRFDPGTSGTTVSGGIVRGEQFAYVLGAAAGQTMSLSVTSEDDNAVFAVYPPDGPALVTEATDEQVVLPTSGDYQIIVGSVRGNASYELGISIVD